jgi:hypothetical protein
MGFRIFSHRQIEDESVAELFCYEVDGDEVDELAETLQQSGHHIQAVIESEDEPEPDRRSRRRR